MPVMLVTASLGSVIDKCIHSLSWLEQGANKTNIVGLIPLFPRAFTSELDSVILVCLSSEYSVILLTVQYKYFTSFTVVGNVYQSIIDKL